MSKNWKIVLLIFVLTISLIGCQNEKGMEFDITTYNEFIENGQIEVYGKKHTIESIAETSYKYDGNNNLLRTTLKMNDSNLEIYTEFKYMNNVLYEEIEEYKMHSEVIMTRIHNYSDDGKRFKSNEIADKGENYTTEYEYNDKINKKIIKNEDSNLNGYIEQILDNNKHVVKETFYSTDNTTGFTKSYSYENDLLVKSVYEYNNYKTDSYYEYNQLGDLIFSYDVSYQDLNDEKPMLTVNYFVYEYNNDQHPITMKKHEIRYPSSQ